MKFFWKTPERKKKMHNKTFNYRKRWYFNQTLKPFSVFVLDEPSAFYAEEIYSAVEGLGTKDSKLQQIFVQRSEVQLFINFFSFWIKLQKKYSIKPSLLKEIYNDSIWIEMYFWFSSHVIFLLL